MTASSSANPFHYINGTLHCEDVALDRLAAEQGTPLYVYSRGELERAYRAFTDALTGIDHKVCFSVKANSSIGVLSVLAKLGAGADIVSYGELYRWQRAGGDPGKVVFSGVGKTDDEMAKALDAGILIFNVESDEELDALSAVATKRNKRARVALRVNPDVDPETHPYISTGLKQNKFGVSMADAPAILRRAKSLPGLDIVGIDCHIGSQLTKTSPFTDAIARLVDLVLKLRADDIAITSIDIGGGLGIDYGKGDAPPPSPAQYGVAVRKALLPLTSLGISLLCEPGRVIVGQAGALLTSVVFRKTNEAKHFTIIDGAMNDLMRPVLYGSFHPMWPVTGGAGATGLSSTRTVITTDIVGPICETGDFLGRDRSLPAMARGELLAIGACGAYGAVMASNYNTRPRAPEILVAGDSYVVIRKRETLEQLLANETVPG
jgi:diaminopimelate decarboxylase